MKALLFLTILGCSCIVCNAQDTPTNTEKDFQRHEISVSYGFMPISDWSSLAEEALIPVVSMGLAQSRVDGTYRGAFNLSYAYRINRKISVGITGGMTANNGFIKKTIYHENKIRDDRKYLYVLPTFRYNWFARPNFNLYSSVGLGAYFLRNRIGDETIHKTKLAYQVNFIGLEYGKQVAFFVDFGVGNAGSIALGLRVKL